MLTRTIALALVTSLLLIAPTRVDAGAPCVCWEVAVGEAPVLDVKGRGLADLDLAAALLKSLDNQLPVLARMENLRRSALALQGNSAAANYILARLQARVLHAETGKAQDRATLWFDAGYAVACFNQAGQIHDIDGYRWIARAITLSGGNGAMHYGAALAVLMPHPDHGMFKHHLRQMKAAAAKDTLLAKNFETLATRYPAVLRYFAKKK